jgi:undecaprenyl-diphosphatase
VEQPTLLKVRSFLASEAVAGWRRPFSTPGWSCIAATILALLIGIFAELARPHAVDEPVLEGVQWAQPGIAHITWFFNTYLKESGIPALWIMSMVWLGFSRGRWGLVLLFGLAVLALPINEVLKDLYERPRPAGDFAIRERPDGMSFPSSHTMTAMVFFGLWAMVAPLVLPRLTHWPVRLSAAFIVVMTALCRVWVGAHWPTDVVAGALFGAAFVGLLWGAHRDIERLADYIHERLHTLDVWLLGHSTHHEIPRPHAMVYVYALI